VTEKKGNVTTSKREKRDKLEVGFKQRTRKTETCSKDFLRGEGGDGNKEKAKGSAAAWATWHDQDMQEGGFSSIER